jgi:hypothetical protein
LGSFWHFGVLAKFTKLLGQALSCLFLRLLSPCSEGRGIPFLSRVQTDDKDSPVNFTFYREPVLSCCLQGAPVVGLQFTG